MSQHISIQNLNFLYESQSDYLFQNLNLHFSLGWTGIVGKNGSGKTTLARIIAGQLTPDSGIVLGNDDVFYVSQNLFPTMEELSEFLYDSSKVSGMYKNLLEVKIKSPEEFELLSYGEKRRIVLALALSRESEVLILDEPTNHLDFESIRIIKQSLKQYRGIGILICHDRVLLDDLTFSCIFLEKNFFFQRQGNYSEGKKEMEREKEELIRNWKIARSERKKLDAELKRRREEASLSHKLRSKKGLKLHDHDGRAKKNLARVTGKDGMAGRLKNQIEKRSENSETREKEIFDKLPEKEKLGINWKTLPSKRKSLFFFDGKSLDFDFIRLYMDSPLQIVPSSKIAINGLNGSGKSTLLKFIVKELEKKEISYFYLPQEFSKEEAILLHSQFLSFDSDKKAKVLAGIHRLGTDPKRFSESESLSPGETKKLFLSIHLENSPEILLLDEPTNHLDVKSIEAIENSLSSLGSPLVVVSHDRRFLESISNEEWSIDNYYLTQIHPDKSKNT